MLDEVAKFVHVLCRFGAKLADEPPWLLFLYFVTEKGVVVRRASSLNHV